MPKGKEEIGCAGGKAKQWGGWRKALLFSPNKETGELKRIYKLNPKELGELIEELKVEEVEEKMRRLAYLALGTPYQPQAWEGKPTFNLKDVDCVTFVEQIVALALASDKSSLVPTLLRLRFKDGVIGPLTRNHFIAADWLPNNFHFLEDVTQLLGGERTAYIEKTINRKEFFKKRGLKWEGKPTTIIRSAYLPRSILPALVSSLPPLTIIPIVKERPDVVITHLGFGIFASTGGPKFIHASQESKAVVETNLLDYIIRDKEILGIKVIRLKEKWKR